MGTEFLVDVQRTPWERAALLLKTAQQQLPHLQLNILHKNWWLAKPVDGAMGKGIVLFGGASASDNLAALPLPFSGRTSEGYVLQKYLETPHLVDISLLNKLDGTPNGHAAACTQCSELALYKYNLRMFVLVRWVADPSVWVYNKGYIDLCARPFVDTYGAEVQEAHISNLSIRGRCGSSSLKRIWSTATFRRYLQQSTGRDVWEEDILPGVRTAVARIMTCLLPLRAGGQRHEETAHASQRQPWRRLGFDFALDNTFHTWLLEVNHRPGMRSPKGLTGEDKRHFLEPQSPKVGGFMEIWM